MSPHYGAPIVGPAHCRPFSANILFCWEVEKKKKKRRRKKHVSFLLEKITIAAWFRKIRKINKWIKREERNFSSEYKFFYSGTRDCNRAERKVVPSVGRFLDQEWSTAGDKVVKSRFDARNFLPITDFDAPSPRYSTTSKHRATVAPLTLKKIQYVFYSPLIFSSIKFPAGVNRRPKKSFACSNYQENKQYFFFFFLFFYFANYENIYPLRMNVRYR